MSTPSRWHLDIRVRRRNIIITILSKSRKGRNKHEQREQKGRTTKHDGIRRKNANTINQKLEVKK